MGPQKAPFLLLNKMISLGKIQIDLIQISDLLKWESRQYSGK